MNDSSSSEAAILETRALAMRFDAPEGRISLFENLDLSIQAGDSLAILGTSGSGKSTLLGLLAGLDLPTAGTVIMDTHDLTTLDEDERAALRAGRVGFVFQAFHLLPGLTALENVMLPAELAGAADARSRAVEALRRVGLADRVAHYPAQLSGGEQQRVALARAFISEPQILFADEPTGNLDHRTGEQIVDLLFELNRDHGTTLILVTHDHAVASRCAHIRYLRDGRLSKDAA
ncbi:ABC transporter-like protein [Spiribacter salinus M19-40]|jgi:putative ABC transport system ATP-binding protein|uniref:ABC transporter-like protein n=2 Tax=Spiribacter salinus TaxID=1335746 RepID=R4VMW0_9GAMM|nr:ATP-binding cassette domain-containing protein [Spiribacter salinus]AGM41742.1 ABC transporter-like protein [Spiribacter salinus M19-40]MBY5268708.1 ABC transporter [Spiribacter salinus]MDR9413526.1 ATP-binding cassette domain-containing protein [Spiribacter sp.]TQF00319.1 MAG: ATP-binding cassette domain-containing protein [Spiribacter salinus]